MKGLTDFARRSGPLFHSRPWCTGAGLVLGRKDIIDTIRKHPLIRALRVDKTTLAALQATLLAYLENNAVNEIPVWRMIAAAQTSLAGRSRQWMTALHKEPKLEGIGLRLIESVSTVGGGSLPDQTLPTTVLAVAVEAVDTLADQLRTATHYPPVITRIENDQLILDPRTVLPEQDKTVIAALKAVLSDRPGA